MNGKVLVSLMLGFAAAFGLALIYFQNYAFYQPVELTPPAEQETMMVTDIRLTPLGGGMPETIAVSGFTGIDAQTSPLKFRGCFSLSLSMGLLTETYEVMAAPTPLKAPGWFECFDSIQLTADLQSGVALALLGERNISEGVDRVIAAYPDGRAYAWHQFNEKFSE